MTKVDDEFLARKKALLKKNKETADYMVDMVTDMAATDAIELVHALFDFLRHTEPLADTNHKLHTRYSKDVVNLIYSYQNRYLATFLMISGQEIRDLERAAERAQSLGVRKDYATTHELAKKGLMFLRELLKQEEKEKKEQQQQKNSKERLDPQKQEGAGGEDKV